MKKKISLEKEIEILKNVIAAQGHLISALKRQVSSLEEKSRIQDVMEKLKDTLYNRGIYHE